MGHCALAQFYPILCHFVSFCVPRCVPSRHSHGDVLFGRPAAEQTCATQQNRAIAPGCSYHFLLMQPYQHGVTYPGRSQFSGTPWNWGQFLTVRESKRERERGVICWILQAFGCYGITGYVASASNCRMSNACTRFQTSMHHLFGKTMT